jgi:transcriptional regulator with XRE-family HTH domain
MNNITRFHKLGASLRELRLSKKLNITQFADLIDIDRTHLSKLENGHERPSQDVLRRINNRFLLSRDEALKLWHEAGYPNSELVVTESEKKEGIIMNPSPQQGLETTQSGPQLNININREKVPILYADTVYVMSNDNGLVLDVAQGVGPIPQQHVVSSIGMSKDQAKRMIQAMKDNLGIE